MSKKKYLMSAALLLGAISGSWAQLGGTHNYMDSSYIPARRMSQQNEWRNNSKDQNFPSRPRDMWQVGVTGGLFMIDGDVPALPGWNAGFSIRKAIGYVVSLRGSLTYGETKGLDYRPNRNFGNAPELSRYNGANYVANFKTQAFTPTLEALVSLNNIMFHSKQNKLNVNVGVGYSPFIYKTMMNLFNGTTPYNYGAITNFAGTRKDIRKAINNVLDDSYETPAVVNDRSQNFDNGARGRYNFRHSWLALVGAEYRLNNKISLGFNFKYLFTHDDYIDGWRYQGGPTVQVLTANPDNAIFTNLSLNFNLGSNKKRTAPLWWLNPLDYVYGETNNPVHTKFPPQVLPDADDDGVTDQFDVEPNTPAGAPVDVRGKARDTDGDGVPDFRDKELITPTSCQPVDADGVGKCPCPNDSCMTGYTKVGTGTGNCGIGDLPSVRFAGNSKTLSNDAKAILASAADKMKANPTCVVGIISHGEADKRSQQMSWDKANAVRNYLVQSLGISADRLVFKYGESGSSDTVDLQDVTGSETPNAVPARPEYRRTN